MIITSKDAACTVLETSFIYIWIRRLQLDSPSNIQYLTKSALLSVWRKIRRSGSLAKARGLDGRTFQDPARSRPSNVHGRGDRRRFFDFCSCSKKWLQLLLWSSLEICTSIPVYTPKTWKQCIFCRVRQNGCCSYFAFNQNGQVVSWY